VCLGILGSLFVVYFCGCLFFFIVAYLGIFGTIGEWGKVLVCMTALSAVGFLDMDVHRMVESISA